MKMKQFSVCMREEDIDFFQLKRKEFGMSKAAFIRLLISNYEQNVPSFFKDRDLVNGMSCLAASIKELYISDALDDSEKLHFFVKLDDLSEEVNNRFEQ